LDIFGGFLIIVWMAGLFLTIIWFILPFVIFNIKLRCDEISMRLASIESRLAEIDSRLLDARMDGNADRSDSQGEPLASSLANQDVLK